MESVIENDSIIKPIFNIFRKSGYLWWDSYLTIFSILNL